MSGWGDANCYGKKNFDSERRIEEEEEARAAQTIMTRFFSSLGPQELSRYHH